MSYDRHAINTVAPTKVVRRAAITCFAFSSSCLLPPPPRKRCAGEVKGAICKNSPNRDRDFKY